MPKEYLGDSVYANYDGYFVILTTENGLEGDPSNTILLESRVLHHLNDYVRRLSAPVVPEELDDVRPTH